MVRRHCSSSKLWPSRIVDATVYRLEGDVLDILEWRHDWAEMVFTWDLFKYVYLSMLPEVIMHSQSQDEEQVRGHYDRGDDFYAWYVLV